MSHRSYSIHKGTGEIVMRKIISYVDDGETFTHFETRAIETPEELKTAVSEENNHA